MVERLVVVLVVCLFAGGLVSLPQSKSGAAEVPSDDAQPRRVCDGDTVVSPGGLESGDTSRWARVYVPAGATLTATVSGSKTGDIWARVEIEGAGESTPNWIGPSDPFLRERTWVNAGSGVSRLVHGEAKALFLGHVDYWSLDISITGGDPDPYCDNRPPDADSLDTDNASMPNGCGTHAGDPVNVVQGNFWQTWHDLTVPGRGPSLDLARTYSSSRFAMDGPLGFGWSFEYGMSLSTAPGTVTIRQENGAAVRFQAEGTSWVAPRRVAATLVHEANGSWTFRRMGTEVFTFDSGGKLVSIADLSGNTTTLLYASGLLWKVTDPSGRELIFTWTGSHITSVMSPSTVLVTGGGSASMVVSFGYDGAGDLTSVTESNGGVWTYGYSAHRMTTIREPRHHSLGAAAPVVENHYDTSGRVDWQEDRLDRRTTFAYATGLTTVTDPKGNAVAYEHVDGICTGVIVNPGANQSHWLFEVDPYTLGRTRVTDPNGIVTTAAFNDQSLPTSITTPKGTTTIVYDPTTMRPTTVTDPSGVTTTYSYASGTDRLTGMSRPISPGGGTWTMSVAYGDAANPGRPTSITDSRAKVWSFGYSSQGDLILATDPTGKVTTWAYNTHGWPLSTVDPAGNAVGGVPADHTTSYEYDLAGNVVKATDPLGAVTEYGVDLSGYEQWIKDPVAVGAPVEQTNLTWNAAGELTTVARPDGSTLTTEYWPDGSLKTQRDGATNATGYAYDTHGRLSTVTDPAGRITTYGYDLGGRVTSKQQPGGDCLATPRVGCISYGYLGSGELQTVDYSDSSTPDVTFGYDALGRRTSMVDGAGTSTWAWDSIGRLLSFTDPATGIVSYGYTDNGPQATTLTYPGGKVVQRGYDDAGRQTSLAGWTGGTVGFGYDDNSNLTSTDTGATTAVEDTTGYDRANRPTAYTLRQGASVLASLGYTRDPEGRAATSSGTGLPGVTDSFTYSPLDQLATDATGGYTFDTADNLTGFPDGRRQKFNAGNELCYTATTNTASCATPPAGATTYGYDGRGNRTSEHTASGQVRTLGYDQADRLVSATVPEGLAFQALPQARLVDTRGIVSSSDFDGDRCADVLARVPSTGDLRLYTGSCIGGWKSGAGATIGTGWGGLDPIFSPGDFDGDGCSDVLARVAANGDLRIYRGNCAGGWKSGSGAVIGTSWSAFSAIFSPGDFDGDGCADVLARLASSGDLRLYAGNCAGSWKNGTGGVVGSGWNGLDQILSPGDFDGDGCADVIGRAASNGNLLLYRGNCAGGWKPGGYGVLIGTSWTAFNTIFSAGDFDGDTCPDVFARLAADGTLRLYTGNCAGGWKNGAGVSLGSDWNGLDTIAAAGARPRQAAAIGSCDPAPCSRLVNGSVRGVQIAGRGGVPSSGAVTARLTFTALAASGTGTLSVWPRGQAEPANAQVLTFSSSGPSTVTVTVQLGTDGWINTKASGANVDLLIDVIGYEVLGTATYTYTYAGDGLRRSKAAPDGTVTRYTWDRAGGLPLLLAESIDAPGTANDRTVRYLYGPDGLVTADITTPASGVETIRWYHHDQLGSTRALTDSSGAVIGSYAYTPFGQPAGSTGTATTPMGWAGEYRDTETGYIYLRARHYDPATGQFLTRDPLEALTRSAYAYVGNNPTNAIDPTGLCGLPCVFLVGAVVGGGLDLGFQMLGNLAGGCGALDDINWGSVGFNALLGGGLSVGGAWLASGRAGSALRGINWADDTGSIGGRFTADQGALNAIAKATRGGPIGLDDADTLMAWADEVGAWNTHGPMTHPGRAGYFSQRLHIKIFGRHIEVLP